MRFVYIYSILDPILLLGILISVIMCYILFVKILLFIYLSLLWRALHFLNTLEQLSTTPILKWS